MDCKFVLHVFKPNVKHSEQHIASHELQGLDFDEVLKVFDNKVENFVGISPPPPHQVLVEWSKRFGFEYKPELYEYNISTYDK